MKVYARKMAHWRIVEFKSYFQIRNDEKWNNIIKKLHNSLLTNDHEKAAKNY